MNDIYEGGLFQSEAFNCNLTLLNAGDKRLIKFYLSSSAAIRKIGKKSFSMLEASGNYHIHSDFCGFTAILLQFNGIELLGNTIILGLDTKFPSTFNDAY